MEEKKKKTLEDMQLVAEKRGGKCLSQKYINAHTRLKWECINHHTWETQPANILQGTWCPDCGKMMINLNPQILKKIANRNGGQCQVIKNPINTFSILKWVCEKGHSWTAPPISVIIGWWCPTCRINLKGLDIIDKLYMKTIEEMECLANLHFGHCLSKDYINNYSKLRWECAQKHTWEAIPKNIQNGSWCSECAGVKKYSIEDMQKLAKIRGGKCLSLKYRNADSKLRWECSKKHVWHAIPSSIMKGSWCAICAKKKKHTLRDMIAFAKTKGGKCLSTKYVNSKTNLLWECRKNHCWKSSYNSIQQGSWCPECVGVKKHSIETMQLVAAKRKGKCLSTKYINARTKLKWECINHHTWETQPTNILRGTWCPECSGRKKRTIEDMQNLAITRGGKCLSKKYYNSKTKLKWECAQKHTWETIPNSIQNGSWCPECARRKN